MERTQNEQILEYLKAGNTLTPLEALREFGSFRLGARIFNLKEKGYNIETKLVSNGKKKFAQYRLIGQMELCL